MVGVGGSDLPWDSRGARGVMEENLPGPFLKITNHPIQPSSSDRMIHAREGRIMADRETPTPEQAKLEHIRKRLERIAAEIARLLRYVENKKKPLK